MATRALHLQIDLCT